MAIGGSIFIVTLVIIQKSKYEDIGVSKDSEHYVKVFNEAGIDKAIEILKELV